MTAYPMNDRDTRPALVVVAHGSRDPRALSTVRRLLDRVRAAFVRERSEQDRLMRTSDFTEGVAAVAERRDPRFVGA